MKAILLIHLSASIKSLGFNSVLTLVKEITAPPVELKAGMTIDLGLASQIDYHTGDDYAVEQVSLLQVAKQKMLVPLLEVPVYIGDIADWRNHVGLIDDGDDEIEPEFRDIDAWVRDYFELHFQHLDYKVLEENVRALLHYESEEAYKWHLDFARDDARFLHHTKRR